MFDAFKPGQTIRCTIVREPHLTDQKQTIARLMRQDPAIRGKLAGAQKRRKQNMRWSIRGGRDWAIREQAARYALVRKDSSWSMRFIPQVINDFRSVQDFIKVEKA